MQKIFTSDFFYHPREKKLFPALRKHGYYGVEMEAASLYSVAAQFHHLGVQALCIATITDEIHCVFAAPDALTGIVKEDEAIGLEFVKMPAELRETTLNAMLLVALHTASASVKSKKD